MYINTPFVIAFATLRLLVEAGADVVAGPGNEANHPVMAISKSGCNEFAQLALEYLAGKAKGGKLDWDIVNPENGALILHSPWRGHSRPQPYVAPCVT